MESSEPSFTHDFNSLEPRIGDLPQDAVLKQEIVDARRYRDWARQYHILAEERLQDALNRRRAFWAGQPLQGNHLENIYSDGQVRTAAGAQDGFGPVFGLGEAPQMDPMDGVGQVHEVSDVLTDNPFDISKEISTMIPEESDAPFLDIDMQPMNHSSLADPSSESDDFSYAFDHDMIAPSPPTPHASDVMTYHAPQPTQQFPHHPVPYTETKDNASAFVPNMVPNMPLVPLNANVMTYQAPQDTQQFPHHPAPYAQMQDNASAFAPNMVPDPSLAPYNANVIPHLGPQGTQQRPRRLLPYPQARDPEDERAWQEKCARHGFGH